MKIPSGTTRFATASIGCPFRFKLIFFFFFLKKKRERKAVQRIISRRIGGESLVVLKVLMCGLGAGTPCLPWQQLHPGSLPPHRHVSCQSNPQQQQQHRIAQASPWGADLARFNAPSSLSANWAHTHTHTHTQCFSQSPGLCEELSWHLSRVFGGKMEHHRVFTLYTAIRDTYSPPLYAHTHFYRYYDITVIFLKICLIVPVCACMQCNVYLPKKS